MDRRAFLRSFGAAAGGLAVAGGALRRRSEAIAANGNSAARVIGYGELVPSASANTGEVLVALPKGFKYNVLGQVGSTMSDGRPTPAAHDAMWTFKVDGKIRLVRNHEVSNGRVPIPGSAIGHRDHYDPDAGGGTTTLIIDPKTRTVVKDFVSLSGTLVNCAGGPTPWGSWISCEETTIGRMRITRKDGTVIGGFSKPHGYCFEVPAKANGPVEPVPLKAMGRFVHEAAAVDERSSIVYLTEDATPSGFYRFIPNRAKKLAEGGTLQMLAIAGQPKANLRKGLNAGEEFPATWVTIDDADPAGADVDPLAVFRQGEAKGGAAFARLEGCCTDGRGTIYFASTSGGENTGGQIWRYRPDGKNGGKLTLVYQVEDKTALFMPDNICLMPGSNLLFVCEDGDYQGLKSQNHVRILTPDGKVADLARNISPTYPRSEFAGSTFSPDGKTLFVNLQTLGATLAIWGDWSQFKA